MLVLELVLIFGLVAVLVLFCDCLFFQFSVCVLYILIGYVFICMLLSVLSFCKVVLVIFIGEGYLEIHFYFVFGFFGECEFLVWWCIAVFFQPSLTS